jgi:hypothetical protein
LNDLRVKLNRETLRCKEGAVNQLNLPENMRTSETALLFM